MRGLIGEIVRIVGLTGLRLAQLNLLWIAGTLCGGILLGVGPATAAVADVIRRDALWGREGEWGPRQGVVREFASAWRREFRSANVLAATTGTALALILLELVVLRGSGDVAGSASRTILLAVGAWILVVSALAWSLHAHFDDTAFGVIRRALVFSAGRPLWALLHLAVLAVVLIAYWFVPGLAIVFGVALPVAASFQSVWRSGALPVPDKARNPRRPVDSEFRGDPA